MKKEYLIGLLTGCLLTASALMFMGATDNDSQVGRYQITMTRDYPSGVVIRALDTTNGQQYDYRQLKKKWKKLGTPIQD